VANSPVLAAGDDDLEAVEILDYDVSMRGIVVAHVQVVVGQPETTSESVDGVETMFPAVTVRSHGTSAGIVAAVGTGTWDLRTKVSTRTWSAIGEDETVDARMVGKHVHRERRDFWLAAEGHQTLDSAVLGLRAWRSRPGDARSLQVWLDGHPHPIELVHGGSELLGTMPAIRYEGMFRSRVPVRAWLSNDAARVPLRAEAPTDFGVVRVELVGYECRC